MLIDRDKRLITKVELDPPARILVRNGHFLTHPDYPCTPHICEFEDNPISGHTIFRVSRAMTCARKKISEDNEGKNRPSFN
ncbi:GPI inositol-deacylase [Dirofilaria immitis]